MYRTHSGRWSSRGFSIICFTPRFPAAHKFWMSSPKAAKDQPFSSLESKTMVCLPGAKTRLTLRRVREERFSRTPTAGTPNRAPIVAPSFPGPCLGQLLSTKPHSVATRAPASDELAADQVREHGGSGRRLAASGVDNTRNRPRRLLVHMHIDQLGIATIDRHQCFYGQLGLEKEVAFSTQTSGQKAAAPAVSTRPPMSDRCV